MKYFKIHTDSVIRYLKNRKPVKGFYQKYYKGAVKGAHPENFPCDEILCVLGSEDVTLTLKAPNKKCSRRHFIYLSFFTFIFRRK